MGVSGRQHRPTGHDHESLRYSEVDSDLVTSGPGRESTLDMECTLAGKTVPPGMEVDGPGKLVDSMRRVDQGFAPPAVAMSRAASALRKGEVRGHVGEASGTTSDPPRPAYFHSGASNVGLGHYKPKSGVDRYVESPDYTEQYTAAEFARQSSGGAAHPQGQIESRAAKSNERQGDGSVTLHRQTVCSGENEVLQSDSMSDVSIV